MEKEGHEKVKKEKKQPFFFSIFHGPVLLRVLTNQEALKKQLIKHEWPIITIADAFP